MLATLLALSPAHAGSFVAATADAKANWIANDVMARPTLSVGLAAERVIYVTSVGVAVPTHTWAGDSHGVGAFVREQLRVHTSAADDGGFYVAPELTVGANAVEACFGFYGSCDAVLPYLDPGLAIGFDQTTASGLHVGCEAGADLGGVFGRASVGVAF
jgi:hypothetical protein